MKLEEAMIVSKRALTNSGFLSPKLDYIRNIGEVWSVIWEVRSLSGSQLVEEIVSSDEGRAVGFRKLGEDRKILNVEKERRVNGEVPQSTPRRAS